MYSRSLILLPVMLTVLRTQRNITCWRVTPHLFFLRISDIHISAGCRTNFRFSYRNRLQSICLGNIIPPDVCHRLCSLESFASSNQYQSNVHSMLPPKNHLGSCSLIFIQRFDEFLAKSGTRTWFRIDSSTTDQLSVIL